VKLGSMVIAASLALCLAAPAHAAGTHQTGIEGGTSVPSGDFGDGTKAGSAKAGYNVGGLYQFTITNFGVGAELGYHGWSASDQTNAEAETTNGSGSEVHFSSWQYGVFGTYSMPMPSAQPYVKVGFGYYSPTRKLTSPSGDSNLSDTNPGMTIGVGADFKTPSTMKVGVGATYHRLKDSKTDFVTMTARMMWPLKMDFSQ